MKKCWIINKAMLVDLYDNDLCGLKKSIKWVKSHQQIFANTEESNDFGQNFIGELALILRLKFSNQL